MARPRFQQLQYEFAAHLKQPQHNPAPSGIEERRLRIYKELFYNNIEKFIASGFPIIRKLFSDADWHTMVRHFFANHRCQTPYFLEISQEFLAYLQGEGSHQLTTRPFLLELAHYEWMELAAMVAEQELEGEVDPDGDLLSGVPVVSSIAWPLTYQYPVHKIGPKFQPSDTEPAFLLVVRDKSDQVKFKEINALTYHLLQRLQQQERTGAEVLKRMAQELPQITEQQMLTFGEQTLLDLRGRDVLLGTLTTA